jgi:hypothetical protein
MTSGNIAIIGSGTNDYVGTAISEVYTALGVQNLQFRATAKNSSSGTGGVGTRFTDSRLVVTGNIVEEPA